MIVGLFGPHGIGKTTAAFRYLELYPRVTVVTGRRWEITKQPIPNGWDHPQKPEKIDVRGWRGGLAYQDRLVKLHEKKVGTTIIETTRPDVAKLFNSRARLIFVICTPEHMQVLLLDSAEKRGVPYDCEYWTEETLLYESRDRYLNFAKKYLHQSHYKVFEIVSWKDWDDIDKHFAKIRHKGKCSYFKD